ncbi:CRISPR-associated endonuclease Cas2 [Patescibacteria group bacterium]|nr:CRISPR-associated endonuclease Cas2 [Patescibacteria group bacterium]
MSRKLGSTQKKILILLLGGLALGLSRSPKTSFQIIKEMKKEWDWINQQNLKRAIKKLYESKLIKEKENKDGTITLILTDKGKEKALTYNLDDMEIKKPKQWDKKWRIVLFDVPEKARKIRDAFRDHLKNLGFYEFQKSVFVHPYDCQDEIEYLIEFYDARKFIRFVTADKIDNELHLKHYFRLLD